ncbi:hypothetical protein KW798_03385 [Candidatus Parcubacteria bacterium]|nr:hypothetical protein [Candidatus Parcubacteria bacterium]
MNIGTGDVSVTPGQIFLDSSADQPSRSSTVICSQVLALGPAARAWQERTVTSVRAQTQANKI